MGATARPAHGGYPGEVVATRPHTALDCEAELRQQPDYSVYLGRPTVFVCSCGREWEHYDDEAEGGGWVPVDGTWRP